MTLPHNAAKSAQDETEDIPTPSAFAGRISPDSFESWYRERQFRENIQNGNPYFNGPALVKSPDRHSPSQLLQCKRKIAYRQLNAPEETVDPTGIFWFGTQFEEDIAVPYLREAVVGPDTFVCNSLWVDFTVETDVGEIRIKGETDPIIVDSDAKPHLVTEIKTKSSVSDLDAPNQHHKAQIHAYLYGLSEKYDRELTEAVILYGSRDTLQIESFPIEFEADFWSSTVVDWAADHSEYRLNHELPPADPEYSWECKFCSFKNRCGEGDVPIANTGPAGLLPKYDYPRSKVETYLEAHAEAMLTPTLAQTYPGLAEDHEVYDWHCPQCGDSYPWADLNPGGTDVTDSPLCPACLERGQHCRVRGPHPSEQHAIDWERNNE